ncbi:mitochondrial carrier domain-containing protein [Limtongia smithiae]|uniref:mitochondrial carrier domain-containing protein n=1 Tax=Limtongia smithiae TaxID=1125753 RepID=UPI0034D011A6
MDPRLARSGSLRPYYHRPELVFQDGMPDYVASKAGGPSGSTYSAKADALLADLDYADYLEFPNATELIRGIANAALARYSSTFLAQPFEVAKMVLQCGKYPRPGFTAPSLTDEKDKASTKPRRRSRRSRIDDVDTFEVDMSEAVEDDEEVDYFSTPGESSRATNSKHSAKVTSSSDSDESIQTASSSRKRGTFARVGANNRKSSSPVPESYQIGSHRPYILGAMGALWAKDGPWGVWRGTNITFVESLLFSTLETWLSAFLSAVFSIPDPLMFEIIESSHPLMSLFTSITATTLATLALSPIDIVRTKLILTPTDAEPRSLVASLQCLPSLACPSYLVLPTALSAAVPKLISRGTPYLLRARWGIEQFSSPMAYGILTFVSSTVELFVRLPLETVLRRGQLAYVGVRRTLVGTSDYNGVLGSMWDIISGEDNGDSGLEGLWRGWRVGMLGILGTWGISSVRSRASNYGGREERF